MNPAAPAGEGLRLALAGGGTGGHLVPGLHLLDDLLARGGRPSHLLWLRGGRPVEERVLAGLAERLAPTPVDVLDLRLHGPGGHAPSRARQARALPRASLAARAALRAHRSQVLLGLGGFVCGPAVAGAKLAGVPRALLEINAAGGTATSVLGRLASRVFHAWPETVPAGGGERHLRTGAPVGPAFRPADPDRRRAAKAALGLDPGAPLLAVLGGSQGASALNRFVTELALRPLAEAGCSIVHQTGPGKAAEGDSAAAGEGRRYVAQEYIDDVAGLLAAADVVLARGGASTLAEVAAAGVPVWVVPYPHHGDRHQERNARQLGEGARTVPEAELGPQVALELVQLLGAQGQAQRATMAAALARLEAGRAAERIWDELAALARG